MHDHPDAPPGVSCPDCDHLNEEIRSTWRVLKRQTCDRVAEWAQGVLADPDAVLLVQHTNYQAQLRTGSSWSTIRVTDPTGRTVFFETDGLNGPDSEFIRDRESGRAAVLYTGDTDAWIRAYRSLDQALTGKRIILAAQGWLWGYKGDQWWAAVARDLDQAPLRHTVAAGDDLDARAHPWYTTMPEKTSIVVYDLRTFADIRHGSWALPGYGSGYRDNYTDVADLTAYAAAALADMATGIAPGNDELDD